MTLKIAAAQDDDGVIVVCNPVIASCACYLFPVFIEDVGRILKSVAIQSLQRVRTYHASLQNVRLIIAIDVKNHSSVIFDYLAADRISLRHCSSPVIIRKASIA